MKELVDPVILEQLLFISFVKIKENSPAAAQIHLMYTVISILL